jgi:hypothetical protein
VIPKFGTFFAISATLSCLVMIFSGIGYLHYRSEFVTSEHGGKEFTRYALIEKTYMDFWIKVFRKTLIIFLAAIILSTVIPKRDTIMMIAASEYGETVLKSDNVQEIVNPAKQILKKWIEDQLAKTEKE